MANKRLLGAVILTLAIAAAATVIVLAAVRRQQEESALIAPEKYITAALDGGAFSETLYAVDSDIGFMLYGLNSGDYSFAEFYFSDGATAEEFIYLTAKSTEAYNAALTAIQRRVSEQIAQCTGYLPAEIPKLENAITQQAPADLTLSFAVANDYSKLPATLYDE